MKLHKSVVDKLIGWCTNYGGHSNETKLANLFQELRVTPYVRSGESPSKESMVLVETQQYLLELNQRGQVTVGVVPMKLHGTVLNKLMELYKSFSGHAHETKLRRAFQSLDFTPYEAKTTGTYYVVMM